MPLASRLSIGLLCLSACYVGKATDDEDDSGVLPGTDAMSASSAADDDDGSDDDDDGSGSDPSGPDGSASDSTPGSGDPTTDPTGDPTTDPTTDPTGNPTTDPTTNPTGDPTTSPTGDPTDDGSTSGDPTSDSDSDPTSDSGDGHPPPLQNGCNGYATRYWDCCKAHCGWSGNVPGGVQPLTSCNVDDAPQSGQYGQPSSCESGSGSASYTCHGLSPWSVSPQLAYGFAAVPSGGDICGRCYQLEFDGSSHNGGADPGSAALANKTMIVQAINIGFDVGGGQFDLLIPGGGVGLFDACSSQLGVGSGELGATYGGLLSACKDQLGYDAPLDQYKSCVTNRCNNVFAGHDDLLDGCDWFVDWFETADNPNLQFAEVECPNALVSTSAMDRSALDDVSNSCP